MSTNSFCGVPIKYSSAVPEGHLMRDGARLDLGRSIRWRITAWCCARTGLSSLTWSAMAA